jgi:hypothetical protein
MKARRSPTLGFTSGAGSPNPAEMDEAGLFDLLIQIGVAEHRRVPLLPGEQSHPKLLVFDEELGNELLQPVYCMDPSASGSSSGP